MKMNKMITIILSACASMMFFSTVAIAAPALEVSTFTVILSPAMTEKYAGSKVMVRAGCQRGASTWKHIESNSVMVSKNTFAYTVVIPKRCEKYSTGVTSKRRKIREVEVRFSSGKPANCQKICVNTGLAAANMTIPVTGSTCPTKVTGCPDSISATLQSAFKFVNPKAFASFTLKNLQNAFSALDSLTIKPEASYSTVIQFAPGAVDKKDEKPIKVRTTLHCGLVGYAHHNDKNVGVSSITKISPKKCNFPTKGTGMDISLDSMPLHSDGSNQARMNFCITRYIPGKTLQGYRTRNTTPCNQSPAVTRPEAVSRWQLENYENDTARITALNALVNSFAPLLWFHKDEKYFPTNVESFVKQSSLTAAKRIEGGPIVLEEGDVTVDDIARVQVVQNSDKHQNYLGPNKALFKGNLKNAQCYAYPRYTAAEDAIDITYLWLYGYSGAIPDTPLGEHEGDWERVTVRLDKTASEVYAIYYSAHGKKDGIWQIGQVRDTSTSRTGGNKGKLLENPQTGYMMQDNRPIVFTGQDTHANYSWPGLIAKFQDRTGKGTLLDCKGKTTLVLDSSARERSLIPIMDEPSKEISNIVARSAWIKFQGAWGASLNKSPLTPSEQGFWNVEKVEY